MKNEKERYDLIINNIIKLSVEKARQAKESGDEKQEADGLKLATTANLLISMRNELK